ncbi:MTPN, partial [Symbiodinium sp. CCMP2456]
FHWAAGNGHLDVLRLLAQWAAETLSALEPLTWNQRTPFHYAARNGQLEVCQWLLEARCDAQRPARDEVSPLQLAVWQNHLTTSQWFVQEAGADALQRNRFGCSVAHWLSQAPAERAGQPPRQRSFENGFQAFGRVGVGFKAQADTLDTLPALR